MPRRMDGDPVDTAETSFSNPENVRGRAIGFNRGRDRRPVRGYFAAQSSLSSWRSSARLTLPLAVLGIRATSIIWRGTQFLSSTASASEAMAALPSASWVD